MKRRPTIIAVFGSSRPRFGDAHYAQAHTLGTVLAGMGFVVCTGGYAGIMEAVSRGAKEAGGRTIGVTAKSFSSRANEWIDEEIRVKTWQERLFELVKRGRGYVACRGGTGTLAELAVVWEMLNKGILRERPIVAMGGFWRPVIECVREAERKHLSASDAGPETHIRISQSPTDAASYLGSYFERQALKKGSARSK
jgi:uncharacterized protein (TIGR00730 family)